MKRIVTLALYLVIVFCLFGCDSEETVSVGGTNNDTSFEQQEESKAENESTDDEVSRQEEQSKSETDNGDESSAPEDTGNVSEDVSAEESEDEDQILPEESTEPDSEVSKDTLVTAPRPNPDASTGNSGSCSHASTKTANKVDATCTKAGYTGDKVCTKCGETVEKGKSVDATGHLNTKIINKKSPTCSENGYTGDTYCEDCKTTVSKGKDIDKLLDVSNKVTYKLPDGTTVTLDKGQDLREWCFKTYTKYITHQNKSVEDEILSRINLYRKNAGISPLAWHEDSYYFAELRSREYLELFSHTRPNGKAWNTVYTDSNIVLVGFAGENLFKGWGYDVEEIAAVAVEAWMNSPGHKANIMDTRFNYISIAFVEKDGVIAITQHFFS